RGRARGEGDRERRGARVDVPGDGGDRGERGTLFGERAGDLLDQQGRAGAAAAGGPRGAVDRDVVVDEDALHLRLGVLGGELEVHDVARVVLHDVDDPRAAVHGPGGGQDLVRDG